MNSITEPPASAPNFGLDFNYALWVQNTRITLVNVPWNNDYRDIVKFANKAALNTYIDSLETSGIVLDNISYLKPTMPIRIDVPFNVAYRYNYLRASNSQQPILGDIQRDFYYFITDVRYIAPNTTELVLQLDVWQTFGFDITFGNSYIERGHIGIANTKAFDNYGRDYLTIPEGLDVGGEYRIINRKHEQIMGLEPANLGGTVIPVYSYNVLVVSTVDLTADAGTATNPKLNTAKGSGFEGLPSGASIYVFKTISSFRSFMTNFSDKPWITQGIISITLIPEFTRYQPDFQYTDSPTEASKFGFGGSTIAHDLFTNWRNSSEILNQIPARYRHLKKFLTYPYMVIEMTTWTGKPILIKPESWAENNATVIERASFTPPNQRVEFFPRRYNAAPNSEIDNTGHLPDNVTWVDANDNTIPMPDRWKNGDDGGEYLDLVTSIANFPALSIVNNGAISYLASNNNTIAFSRQSADWSQQRALASNQTTYDQQSAGIEMAKNINALERAGMGSMVASDQLALRESTMISGASGVIGGGLGMGLGGIGGGLAGAAGSAGGVVGGVQNQIVGGMMANVSVDRSNRNLATQNTVSRGTNVAQTNQQALLRDTNKSLSDWAAKGDYSNAIAGINAKVQDAQLIQPTTSGQIGGESINMVHSNVEVSIRWKLIDNAAIRTVGEYWLRYGYAVRQFAPIPASLMAMTKFTYWKLSETYISSAFMPEYFKQAIRGIFEKGVTVWADPADIGNINIADNEPLGGITL